MPAELVKNLNNKGVVLSYGKVIRMPVYTPKHTLTIKCKKCGWAKDYKRGGYGDVVDS
ncbi:MAG: hypothetical protein HZB81_05545 [Deltaproteobacteria bacterium]|nr:hypothetical protein [Deltaproteobacteria bacterium]